MDLFNWISLQSKAAIVPPIPKSVETKDWIQGPLYDVFLQEEPLNGDTKLSLVDSFDSILNIPDDCFEKATADPDTNLVHIPLEDGYLKLMLYSIQRATVPSNHEAPNEEDQRPTLGLRKAKQIGEIIGTLVRNEDGRVAAVTDLGRVTWLSQEVEKASEAPTMAEALSLIETLKERLTDALGDVEDEATSDFGYDATWDAEKFLEKAGLKPKS